MAINLLVTSGSDPKHHELRNACRTTWLQGAPVPYVFVLGQPSGVDLEGTASLAGDQLYLPIPGGYPHLPQRTREMLRWALSAYPQATHFFKCDDDTYVALDRLLAYPYQQFDYVGAEWKPGTQYGSGGAGYFLSRRAAKIVAEELPDVGAEDLLVGRVLRRHGIYLHVEPRLIPFGNLLRAPRPDNDLLTSHYATPESMLTIHHGLHH